MKFIINRREERKFQGGEKFTKNETISKTIETITSKKEVILLLLSFINNVVVDLKREGNWTTEIFIPASDFESVFDIITDSYAAFESIDGNGEWCTYNYTFMIED
jgi:hypothetical protein